MESLPISPDFNIENRFAYNLRLPNENDQGEDLKKSKDFTDVFILVVRKHMEHWTTLMLMSWCKSMVKSDFLKNSRRLGESGDWESDLMGIRKKIGESMIVTWKMNAKLHDQRFSKESLATVFVNFDTNHVKDNQDFDMQIPIALDSQQNSVDL